MRTAVREVAIAGELLTSLVSEFQSGAARADMPGRPTQGRPGDNTDAMNQARSNRSAFITLVHAATKSVTNFSCASSLA